MAQAERSAAQVRQRVVQALSFVEDIVYVALGILLTATALVLSAAAIKSVAVGVWSRSMGTSVVGLLDQILLILLIIELLYTVQVSFREHGLVAEPFIVVALIAAIRRVLVLTAEIPKLPEAAEPVFHRAILELALLTIMILVLVGSLIALQRQARQSRM